jgi:isopentenyl phosphate kinase
VITFIKLGGSLVTDKRVEKSFRQETANQIAHEISESLLAAPHLQLLIGHGSGSFGHITAKTHKTIDGVYTQEQWRGFAAVATVASHLNFLMASTLEVNGVPVWRIQPSASAKCRDGAIESMALEPIKTALEKGIVPLVYGDVAIDSVRGGTITSTETIFFYLAQHIPVQEIYLLGEVDGVLDPSGGVVPKITPDNLPEVEHMLGGSSGTDVTGGMETKVRDMVALVQRLPHLRIRIMSGLHQGLLKASLTQQSHSGTLIAAT